jgi:pimeloyl-ACP methyl ester carboxylesterase
MSSTTSRPLAAATATAPLQTARAASASQPAGAAVELAHVEFHGSGGASASSDRSPLLLPPVVLLHGLLGNKRNFATVANSLKNQLHHGRPRRLIGLDLRNHGACMRLTRAVLGTA